MSMVTGRAKVLAFFLLPFLMLHCCDAQLEDQTLTQENIEEPYLFNKNMKSIIGGLRQILQALYENLLNQKRAWLLKQGRSTTPMTKFSTVTLTVTDEDSSSQTQAPLPSYASSSAVTSTIITILNGKYNEQSGNAVLPLSLSGDLLSWIQSFDKLYRSEMKKSRSGESPTIEIIAITNDNQGVDVQLTTLPEDTSTKKPAMPSKSRKTQRTETRRKERSTKKVFSTSRKKANAEIKGQLPPGLKGYGIVINTETSIDVVPTEDEMK
ncbi:uncharacterized protein [Ambystoma mexicanum]|uniref:uncharacterized protein n=1 Tax=Ambystoma mexicanum TaxID=8296 RepID=UPI0037E7FD92